MPIYEYKCRKCGKQFEVSQKISEKALSRCPTCRGEVYRLISAPALQFKGTGWYVTDYARKGSGNGEKKDREDKEEKREKKDREDKKRASGEEGEKKKSAEGAGAASEGGKKKTSSTEPKASSKASDD